MHMHIFSIPALAPGAAQDELNSFLASHRVAAVERRFVDAGLDSHWALCLTMVPGPHPLPAALKADAAGRTGKIDYKQVLSEADFAVYADLRSLRKTLAEAAGVPVYAVFTNEQLAAMVQQRASTTAALQAIDGVGPARVQRYAAAFVERLNAAFEAAP